MSRTDKITIRRARLDEAGSLTDLSMRAKRSNGYDDAFMEACRDELTVTGERLDAGEYWVAEADEIQACVCLLVDADDRSGEIHAFFVDPAWQRKGIGRELWQYVKRRAMERGLSTLSLDSDPFAVPFYQAMGFEIVSETPSGSIKGRFLPRMRLTLSAQ